MSAYRVFGSEVQKEEEMEQEQEHLSDELSWTEGEIFIAEKAKDDSSSKNPMQTVTTDYTEEVPSSATPQSHPDMEAQDPDENITSNTESGDSSRTRRPGKEEVQEDTAAMKQIYHSPSTKVDVFTTRKFLFKMLVTPRDVVQGRLFIPVEIALHHFSTPPAIGQPYKEKIKISNLQNLHWFMTSTYDHGECGFVISSAWQEFSVVHNLEANDVLYFYRPFRLAQKNHYLVIVFKRHQEPNTVPQFKQENYLFQRELTHMDVNFMLSLPRREVNFHFPSVRIPAETHKQQRLYFTDARNKDWCMNCKLYSENYIFCNGWEEFVEEHKLETGDVIRFYIPIRPFDSRHFLIQHVKGGEGAGSSHTSQPGTSSAGNNGSGDGKGDVKQRKSEGRSSPAGGRNEKKFSTGRCCMA